MTPREFDLKFEGWLESEAWKVMLQRKAEGQKQLSIDKLLGRNEDKTPKSERKKRFEEANAKMGAHVIPIRKRA